MNSTSHRPRRRVVVIGGGMAGARLARQLAHGGADRGGDGRGGTCLDVVLVGEEPHAPYNRVLLADVLAGRYAPDVVTLPATGARQLRGVRAVRVDRAERRVMCDDGTELTYDALVLAAGAAPVLPPLRGLFTRQDGELPEGVRAFRTMDDCLALRGAARPGVPAVVAGGGLLGVSAARALARCGARVVLAHQGERLMERQLDAESAALLRLHLEELGVEVHTECRVRGLRTAQVPASARPSAYADSGDGPGHGTATGARGAARTARAVRAVELADGCTLDAHLLVLACGVRPRTRLAQSAGIEVARGVAVDDRLRTSDPHVYAIGDCAEHDGVLYGLAAPAQEQADALARVLLAEYGGGGGGAATCADVDTDVDTSPPRYGGTRALTRLTLPAGDPPAPPGTRPRLALDLAAFGDPLQRADDHVVHLSDATRGVYRKVVVREDRLVGGILLGDLTTVGTLAHTWESDGPLPAEPLLHLLTHDGEDHR